MPCSVAQAGTFFTLTDAVLNADLRLVFLHEDLVSRQFPVMLSETNVSDVSEISPPPEATRDHRFYQYVSFIEARASKLRLPPLYGRNAASKSATYPENKILVRVFKIPQLVLA